MKVHPSDPDIQTICKRIEISDLDLQPEFQRGEVWSPDKKQRLIDTILRGWHVPPVHVIELEDGRQEVLDGQQRLATIRDFVIDGITVNGQLPPAESAIQALHGLTFGQLPADVRRRFLAYPLRVNQITEYKPGEPGELFFRLNQPTSLTAAETRNAFIGAPRTQVKALALLAQENGVTGKAIGMRPTRLSYEDVAARLCATLEHDSLLAQVTANDITERYRIGAGFDEVVIQRAERTLRQFGGACTQLPFSVRLNKATLHSWLLMFASSRWTVPINFKRIAYFICSFEHSRSVLRAPVVSFGLEPAICPRMDSRARTRALITFNDRASSRVSDVASVMLRDALLWLLWHEDAGTEGAGVSADVSKLLTRSREVLEGASDDTYTLELLQTLFTEQWGTPL
jgi:hypothetical protein